MKNKTTVYLLLAGVLLVWGLIFYRIFSGLGSDEGASFVLPTRKAVVAYEKEEDDALVLLANYRDPFLGGTTKAISSSGSYSGNHEYIPQKKVKKPEVKKETIVIDWSFLDYVGIVFNKESKKKVGLLVVSGKEYMVNESDVINEVTILRKERDSIQVMYLGEKKWIRR